MSASHTTARREYIDGSYAAVNPEWHEGDSAWKAEQIHCVITRNKLRPRSVCEVGCGAGQILLSLQQLLPPNVDFTGYEPSPQAFQIAARKSNARLAFFNASMPNRAYFDLVLLIDVFEHVEDYFTFLRDLRGLAREFVFHIPLDISVLSVLREWPLMKRRRGVGHIHYFTKATALATLEDTGFRVLDYSYTSISRPDERSWKTMLIRQLPQGVLFRLGLRDLAVRIFGEHSLMVLAAPFAEPEDRQ